MRFDGPCGALFLGVIFASVSLAQLPPASPPTPTSRAAGDLASQLPLFATRQNVFAIPFAVDRRIAQPVDVHLYVSTDQGATWQLSSRQPPDTRQFTFRARHDGEYWFASRTLDANQRAGSQGPLQPELRVVVDTVPPQIEFAAQTASSGEVVTNWQAVDQNLLATSLKVEYQDGAGQPWKLVAVQPPTEDVLRTNYQGQLSWLPETRSPAINIRAEVRDRAGNLAVVNRRLLLPVATADNRGPTASPSARLGDPFARTGQPSEGAVSWPSDNSLPAAVGPNMGPPSNRQPSAVANAPRSPQNAQDQFASTRSDAGQTTVLPAGQLPLAADAAGPIDPRPTQPTNSANSAVPPGDTASPTLGLDPAPVIPTTSSNGATNEDAQGMLPPGERPQITNVRRFNLTYDVDAVGPSGVAEVQLWATADGGQSWRLWGTDDDLQSPFEVVVDQEGIFGFHVVVVSRNGMAGRKPRSGDLADIWIGVDTTSPEAHLTAAVYGEGANAGKLFIRWEATDLHLDNRPITLKFAEHADGPWTVIASALPNSGEYVWPADPLLPASVYLRLEARDEAGNVTADSLKESVRIDGLAPKARIRGVQPLQELDREAFRQPRRS
ncbi:MAG: hypothetical protein ACYC3X_03560 [Pirellulaceae bacterium]